MTTSSRAVASGWALLASLPFTLLAVPARAAACNVNPSSDAHSGLS
jgi:hypothetical protein